jgi:hypothetical protein
MHKIKAKAKASHSSRRAEPLKDSDYDHEINLVDNSAPNPIRTISPESDELSPRTSIPPGAAGLSTEEPQPTTIRVGQDDAGRESEGPTVAIDGI